MVPTLLVWVTPGAAGVTGVGLAGVVVVGALTVAVVMAAGVTTAAAETVGLSAAPLLHPAANARTSAPMPVRNTVPVLIMTLPPKGSRAVCIGALPNCGPLW